MKFQYAFLTILAHSLACATAAAIDESRPLMRDFIGINGHTVQFKPRG